MSPEQRQQFLAWMEEAGLPVAGGVRFYAVTHTFEEVA